MSGKHQSLQYYNPQLKWYADTYLNIKHSEDCNAQTANWSIRDKKVTTEAIAKANDPGIVVYS